MCIICICHYHITATLVNRLLEVASNSPYPPRDKLEHSVVVEAMDPFKWAHTSMSNTYWVLHNLHMLWMCICICPYHFTPSLVSYLIKVALNSGYLLRCELEHTSVMVEAVDPFMYAAALMLNIYKALYNLHMLWMCICICPDHVTTALAGYLLKVVHLTLVTIQGANQRVVWSLRL